MLKKYRYDSWLRT